jgi:CRISPR-associated endonuclease/helicase Cas3
VFRRDLGTDTNQWADIVNLCPPSSSEAVPVPIGVFKEWLAGEEKADESSDVEGETSEPLEVERVTRSALRWNGPQESVVVYEPSQVTPEDLYVIPCSAQDTHQLGDFPYGLTDDAEQGYQRSRDKALLRLTESKLIEDDQDFDAALTGEIEGLLNANSPEWLKLAVNELVEPKGREVEAHPGGGWVVIGKRRLRHFDPTYLEDTEPDDSFRGRAIALADHSRGVAQQARQFAESCGLDGELYARAGLWHDLGKLDPRFQAMLKQASPRTAAGEPLAKSEQPPRTTRDREQAQRIHRYPPNARHELLSAALVASQTDDDLLLYLISTHHGSVRPFAQPVEENEAARKPFKAELFGQSFELPSAEQAIAAWNAELPERFWRVVRKYGWWGTAYREAVFRLADHAQSRAEQEEKNRNSLLDQTDERPATLAAAGGLWAQHSLRLPGLDGGNPLAYLAALGTLVLADRISRSSEAPNWLRGPIALSWQRQTAVLHLPGEPPHAEELAEVLGAGCARELDKHPARFVVSLFENKDNKSSRVRDHIQKCSLVERDELDWILAHYSDSERAADATSQLMTVRKDYFPDNLRSILNQCQCDHLFRALFRAWDYADALDNQSLHWEPSEDRRHAYQWNMPSGDPTRKKRGGVLGANRLALEAWPLFPSMPTGERLATRGFKGNRAKDTYWTWPLWSQPLTRDAVSSMLGIPTIYSEYIRPMEVRTYGIQALFRLQRILVGKTPNFTTATAIA